MTIVTRAARQLIGLAKHKKKSQRNLNDLKNYSEILGLNKKAGTSQRLYNQTGMHSAWDVLKKTRGAK
tara:strand:+ start:38909 stop:39112 length:204 start_codon:yes stop_codon:yes gene_type:complete